MLPGRELSLKEFIASFAGKIRRGPYLSYFESSYMLNLAPRFSWSVKGQMLSEKKVYVVDNGLVNVASVSASKDLGRKFENAVY